MVDVARRHPLLNLLNLEAVAVARILAGTVWLSEQAFWGNPAARATRRGNFLENRPHWMSIPSRRTGAGVWSGAR